MELEPNHNIDVLAVVKECGDMVEMLSKSQKQVL
jgi:hypothetical protein